MIWFACMNRWLFFAASPVCLSANKCLGMWKLIKLVHPCYYIKLSRATYCSSRAQGKGYCNSIYTNLFERRVYELICMHRDVTSQWTEVKRNNSTDKVTPVFWQVSVVKCIKRDEWCTFDQCCQMHKKRWIVYVWTDYVSTKTFFVDQLEAEEHRWYWFSW